ncbi:UVR8 [Scenedesmus sp. PABB004]|nr:UVR8 [Scenedesmus sp. PABB004]
MLDGTARCWGYGSSGQLGVNSTQDAAIPVTVWRDASGGTLTGVVDLACGVSHTCALLNDTTMRCWGFNAGTQGRLGDGTTTDSNTPVVVTAVTGNVTSIAGGGGTTTCALLANGTTQCWGPRPAVIAGTRDAACGPDHCCVVMAADNSTQCWGSGIQGQLGNNGIVSSTSPVTVVTSGGTALTGVSSLGLAGFHSCAVVAGGELGDNSAMGAGNAGTLVPSSFVLLSNPASAAPPRLAGVRTVRGAHFTTCALLETGALACWGYNNYGQLGGGTNTDKAVAVPVARGLGG